MPQESVIDTCDLSHQQLSQVPILRQYKIMLAQASEPPPKEPEMN